MPGRVTVRVPASSANLGPGFDCLGLALDLWNEAEFSLGGTDWTMDIGGEGAGSLPKDHTNCVAVAFKRFLRARGLPEPDGLKIVCRNAIPSGSGLGSSASALLLGLLGANALYGAGAGREEILGLAVSIEGHADNTAAALYGGLTAAVGEGGGWLVRRWDVPHLAAVVVIPEVDLPTSVSRGALPGMVSREDAIFNLGRTALVVEALRCGDMELLGRTMHDRLHQPYRLGLIPGALQALQAAQTAGAAAVALSGAGPSLIAFLQENTLPSGVAGAMVGAFENAGIKARSLTLATTNRGAEVICG
jgi:homoserine kinase